MSKENDKFVLQTRLFVIMRRALTRVIDLEYLRTDRKYAEIILQLAEDSNDADLLDVVAKLRPLMDIPSIKPTAAPCPAAAAPAAAAPASSTSPQAAAGGDKKYIGSLR